MTLSFQNKLIFPAPENSYTVETSVNQVIYVPRDVMTRAERRSKLDYPTNKQLYYIYQQQKVKELERLSKIRERKNMEKAKLDC